MLAILILLIHVLTALALPQGSTPSQSPANASHQTPASATQDKFVDENPEDLNAWLQSIAKVPGLKKLFDQDVEYASPEDVASLAHYSMLAMVTYKIDQVPKWNCPMCSMPIIKDTKPVLVFDYKGLVGYIAVNPDVKAIIVAFRGTSGTRNIFTDLNFPRTHLYSDKADKGLPKDAGITSEMAKKIKVHRGFLKSYMLKRAEIIAQVKQLLADVQYKEYRTVYVVGHSLGGALATICGLDIARSCPGVGLDVAVKTYGAPRVGNRPFVRLFNNTPGLRLDRLVHATDIVPHLPPKVFGFMHAGQEYWLPFQESPCVVKCRRLPDKEDPKCMGSKRASFHMQLHSGVLGYTFGTPMVDEDDK